MRRDRRLVESLRARSEILALGAVLSLAIAVRSAALGSNLSHDEGYSWLIAHAPGWHGFIDRLAAFENTPPLFYLLLRPLPVGDVAWLRLPALIPSVLTVALTYGLARRALGSRVALISALILAVAPYHVAFADYSRGFMLAGLGIAAALWAVIELAAGGSRRWWGLWALGGTVALYSEYYAALYLAVFAVALLVLLPARRREVVAFAALPVLAFLPWLGELQRSLDAVDVTKVSPIYSTPSPHSIRDVVTALVAGEHGSATAAAARWLQLAAISAGLVVGVRRVRIVTDARNVMSARAVLILVPAAAGAIFVLHGLVSFAGPDIFAQRYMTALIPFAAVLGGVAAGTLSRHWQTACVVALVLFGIANTVKRSHARYEPETSGLAAYVSALHPGMVLTNSAVLLYALRDQPTMLDRSFNLGPGRARSCVATCPRPIVIADDSRVAGGARKGPGPERDFGAYRVTIATP